MDGGALVSDPNNNNIYWSGGRYALSPYCMCVSKTTNSGFSWTRYNINAAAGYAYALAVQPGNSNIVYAGGVPGIFKTTNQGTIWNDMSAGIADTVFDLAIDPVSTNIVYAASKAGVYKSTNGGSSWNNRGCVLANAVIIDPMNHNTIYVGTGNGVFISTNAGNTWTAMNQGLDDLLVKSLAINPDTYLFAGTEGSSAYRWQLNVGISEKESTTKISWQCWPAIINSKLNMQYELARSSYVQIMIYDVQGRLIKTIDHGLKPAGKHRLIWSIDRKNRQLANGIFFVVLSIDGHSFTKKILFIE